MLPYVSEDDLSLLVGVLSLVARTSSHHSPDYMQGRFIRMAPRAYNLNFLGDVMLGRLIDQSFPNHVEEPSEAAIVRSLAKSNPRLQEYGPESPWGDTTPLLKQGDLNIINLETSATTHAKKWPNKVFNYRMHPANISALHAAKIHFAGLANNHTLDFDIPGLEQTVRTIKQANIAFAGAGNNQEEATTPAILTLPSSQSTTTSTTNNPSHHHKICIWAASDHPEDWSAIPNFHFTDYTTATKQRLKQLIQNTTPPCTALKIFSIHWGPNYTWHPSDSIREMAHFLIDECDIDIIHGHSSHHVQGVELYKPGKVIIYGCGDFVDDYAVVRGFRNDLGGVWRVVVQEEEGDGDGIKLAVKRLEMLPTKIEGFAARRLGVEEGDAKWVRDTVARLSRALGTGVEVEEDGEGRIVVQVDQG